MEIFSQIIQQAVADGVSEETIALLLLLPLVTSLVAATRHVIGLRGFKILLPSTLAVVFLATGIVQGIILFLVILWLATVARFLLRKFQLQYLPRMALLLWLVTVGVLLVLFLASRLGLAQASGVSILPILILVLLAEEFIAVQIGKNSREATKLTLETTGIALAGYLIFRSPELRKFALENPFWILIIPLIINIVVGRYTGLRLLEYKRFEKLLK